MKFSSICNKGHDVLKATGVIVVMLLLALATCLHSTEGSSINVLPHGGYHGVGVLPKNPQQAGNCDVLMNGGLPNPQPLILDACVNPQDGLAFKRPAGGGPYLRFVHAERVRLVCTGPNNYFFNLGTRYNDIIINCEHSNIFSFNGALHSFNFYECYDDAHNATRIGRSPFCNRHMEQLIEIGFHVSLGTFIKIMDICFNSLRLETKWTRFDLVSEIQGREVGFARPEVFRPGPYFPMANANNFYLRITQRSTIQQIIGQANANHYIHLAGNSYLSRGHLVASSDFLYNTQKAATYYLVNVAPQWYNFNSGTWNQLETQAQFFAHQHHINLIVYTGTYGLTTLPDSCGADNPLYLHINTHTALRRIPAPAVYWKVVYNQITKEGIALVGINYQHKNWAQVLAAPGVDLCPGRHRTSTYWAICNALNPGSQTPGFGYCCEVNDFRTTVNYIPTFPVTGFLQ